MKNLLVACEESQRVCTAFRERGWNAYSCDLQECSGGHPEWHIQSDVLELINGDCEFNTVDGTHHKIDGEWDLIIAHPPCTYLTNSQNLWYNVEKYGAKAIARAKKREEAVKFFMAFANAKCEHIAIENPIGYMSTAFRKPDFIYNPYDFKGETECKRTCLWLKGLPRLEATQHLPKEQRTHNGFKAIFDGKQYAWNDPNVARLRSITPKGVAHAMAEQWGTYLENLEKS